jgi:heptaprenyl diphosphate synthase
VKKSDQFRFRRQQIYERLFSASSLGFFGILVMPALLFNPSPLSRALQFLGFWFLCWLAGKKNKPLITLLVILSIVLFNLIVPYGRILFSVGSFRISSGALMTGIQRAVTLEGLIMLSRFSIRKDLSLPGGFGELISESFRYFALILDSKHRISRRNLISDIDELMIKLSEQEPGSSAAALNQTSNSLPVNQTPGLIILILLGILFWLPMIFSFAFK